MNGPSVSFGSALRALRESLRLSQDALVRSLELDDAFVASLSAPAAAAPVTPAPSSQGAGDGFARDGCPVDRGTMCRWVEDAGATCGATVVHAAKQEALASAFCIATDATGVLVQPIRTHEKVRQACRRGHYFVHIAPADAGPLSSDEESLGSGARPRASDAKSLRNERGRC